MAAFDHIKDLYDVALKPRLLHTLIRDHVPDTKHPLGSPFELSKVVYMINTHNLLRESVQDLTDQKLINNWRSAIDSWVNHLMELIASDIPDKCWAGICLLGVTCQECSYERFLESYSGWFQKLLSHIQSAETYQFVKMASCSSMADLLTRLYILQDGTTHAGKLVQQVIQPVLKLLDGDHSEVVWEGAAQLLCTIMSLFPFSINRHYDTAEDVLASKILSGKCSANILKKLAHCLALLPKSRGDEDSWSLMIQKILFLINGHLNDVFQETKRHEIIRFLVHPGNDTPPLGGNKMSGEASTKARKSSERLPMPSVSALMVCCSTMLTTSYPVQVVTVPIRSFLALIERVLIVDGSLPHSLLAFMTAMQQEFICSELPLLHSYSLELLTAIIEGVRSQLLPHAAYLVRLLSVYLKRCALPELRIKVYSITRILLISMGVGMAVCLAQEVVNSAFIDLNPIANESGGASSSGNSKPSTEALVQTPQHSHRKRKHGASSGSLEWHNTSRLEGGTPKNHTTSPIAVKIAALEALEALLTVGGALKSEGWRSDVDLLLINIATNSLKGAWGGENGNIYQLNEPGDIGGGMQLAALRALLASFLSSSRVRPPYLAEGLDLFRREVLIHPRALPLADFTDTTLLSDRVHYKLPENMYSGSLRPRTPFSGDIQGMMHDAADSDHDDLYDSWLASSKEMEAPVSDLGKTMQAGEPSKTVTVIQDKTLSVDGSFSKETLAGSVQELAANMEDVEMRGNRDESMVESHKLKESILQFQDIASPKVVSVVGTTTITEEVFGRVDMESGPSDQRGSNTVDVLVAKGDESLGGGNFATTPKPEKSKGVAFEMCNDSDEDSFPDIVDPESE
ncbi:hypothetical protein GBA52_009149 [Prunus armeniaca]|nr:hypothetical protein GBA52_009149 [Prunus armeniaca]